MKTFLLALIGKSKGFTVPIEPLLNGFASVQFIDEKYCFPFYTVNVIYTHLFCRSATKQQLLQRQLSSYPIGADALGWGAEETLFEAPKYNSTRSPPIGGAGKTPRH